MILSLEVIKMDKTSDNGKNDVKRLKSCINDRLLILLERKNLKQSELADKIGKSRQYINAIVHHRHTPNSLIKKQIARVLECDTLDIWGENYE